MNATIKDIYAGKPDAKDEICFDSMDDFVKSFVVPPNYNIDDLLIKDDCFITGYKGTGKTALLFYLDNYIKAKDISSCTSFIFFKEQFTAIQKNQFDTISKRIMSSIIIDETSFLNCTDFELIWRWLIFKQILSDNEYYNNQLFIEDEHWIRFKKYINQIKSPENIRKSRIFSRLKFAFPIKDATTATEASPEIEVDFNNNDNLDAYQKFVNIINDAEEEFAQATRTDIPYYIFIDELEAYYGNPEVFQRDLCLLRDLIFTVKRINLHFKNNNSQNSKVICSIRTEILKAISRFTITKELNKVVDGFEVPLIWNYNNTTSYLHPIIQIMLKRIALRQDNNSLTPEYLKEVYQKWFPEKIHDIEPANYILNNSWCKPRDIVRLIIAAQNSIESNNICFSQSVFNACQKRYSETSLEEIIEEMRALYSSKEIDDIISCLTGFKTVFSVKQLKERIDSFYSDTIWNKSFNQIINDLYRLGLLGNYLPKSQTYRWQHKGDDKVILTDEWRLMIHHALQSSLSVGKKQDYGLLRHDPPQIGDVLSVQVNEIGKSFVFVKFKKNGEEYDGVIHISEVSDDYIYALSDYVDYNDIFKAVVLSYNATHQNWQLSIKQVVEKD